MTLEEKSAESAELQAEINRLRAENSVLTRNIQAASQKRFRLAVSEKGCVSVCGLRRFPVSLYPEEWTIILTNAETLKQFIQDNKSKLSFGGKQ
jgi:hypothetical protein